MEVRFTLGRLKACSRGFLLKVEITWYSEKEKLHNSFDNHHVKRNAFQSTLQATASTSVCYLNNHPNSSTMHRNKNSYKLLTLNAVELLLTIIKMWFMPSSSVSHFIVASLFLFLVPTLEIGGFKHWQQFQFIKHVKLFK